MKKKIKIAELENVAGINETFNPMLSEMFIYDPTSMEISSLTKFKFFLQPDFQRKFVWKQKKQKELIKSLYLGIPLPMFYFAKKNGDDYDYEVIDGQQRLTTILGFLNPKIIEKSIRNTLIKNISFRDHRNTIIPQDMIKNKIKDRKIWYVVVKDADLSIDKKYEIFQTLNKGAVPLKPQEIRNCVFQKDLPYLNKAIKNNAKDLNKLINADFSRMEGEEYVLRFYMINAFGYGDKNIADLLDNITSIKRNFTEEKVNELKRKFKNHLGRLQKLLGVRETFDSYFQVLKSDVNRPAANAKDLNSYIFSGKINQGLFHLFSFYLPKFNENQFNKINFSRARKGFVNLLKHDAFIGLITGSGTNSPKKVKKSKELFEKEYVCKYLGEATEKSRRNISPQERKTLFKNVPYCYLCYGQIKNLKDAEGEHIESYANGSESDLGNNLLAHRSCNRRKSKGSLEKFRETTQSISERTRNKKYIDRYLICVKKWHKLFPLKQIKVLKKYAKADKRL